MTEMKYSQDWSGMKTEEKLGILKKAFEGAAALPNQVVADSLHGEAEIGVLENSDGKYTSYEIEDNRIVWICGECGKTTSFGTKIEHTAAGGNRYYENHAPDYHPASK